MATQNRNFYKYFYDINESPRLVKFECSDPQTSSSSGSVYWAVDRAVNLIGRSVQPTIVFEREFCLEETLSGALSGLSSRIEERITWMEVRLEMARDARDEVALSELWNKEK